MDVPYFNPRLEVATTRHKLRHWQQSACPVMVNFRLSDSIPSEVLAEWKRESESFKAMHPQPWGEEVEREYHERFTKPFERWLDAGHGCCAMRDPRVAQMVAGRLLRFHEARYDLTNFVVMPNHVHVLFSLRPGHVLSDVLQGWKGVSSGMVHKAGLCDLNPFWQPDYFDRLIRNGEHFEAVLNYIRRNPTIARLREGEFFYWEKSVVRSREGSI
jgi:putative transposase